MGSFQGSVAAALLAAACAAQACEVPGDGTSLRRALLRVKYLPETETWELAARKTHTVQYVLSLDAPLDLEGRCYWPIEARSNGTLWRKFYATPRGEFLLVAGPEGRLIPLEAWRAGAR
ncbi:MAG: hypothetical protein OEO84_12365 [Betaproteobacteria bacterium]|nr:hypothetical protein [Betaproteobacteria bacterium]